MEKIYKVAIIGGGFSGLICAEVLSANFGGEEILVLEKNDRVGKKLSAICKEFKNPVLFIY